MLVDSKRKVINPVSAKIRGFSWQSEIFRPQAIPGSMFLRSMVSRIICNKGFIKGVGEFFPLLILEPQRVKALPHIYMIHIYMIAL